MVKQFIEKIPGNHFMLNNICLFTYIIDMYRRTLIIWTLIIQTLDLLHIQTSYIIVVEKYGIARSTITDIKNS